MLSRRILFGLCIALALVTFSTSYAVEPDPSIWGPANVTNPGGLRPVPVVSYDPATGVMSVDTRGLDRVSNTAGGSPIGGDDVGMISLLVTGPQGNFLGQFNNQLANGVFWSSQYFNGKMQAIGQALFSQFLNPPDVYAFAQYAPNLTLGDFGQVEMAVNFVQGQPGNVLFGRVQIPEPASMSLLSMLAFGLYGAIRRR